MTDQRAQVTDGGRQVTLSGEERDTEPVMCRYYDHGVEAKYMAELFDYEIGEVLDVPVCGSCRSEILETKDAEKVRPLRLAERWDDDE